MADTSVKWLHSGMTGAPQLQNVAGHLVSLLDAVLVNGWGTNNVDSIVVSGGIATVTRASGHPFEKDMVVEIAGATPAGLNGQKKVVGVGATTYTFDATGVSNQTATGTITHKVASAGWTKAFSGTNKAAYKSANVVATGAYLRVDDTGTTTARVVGYATMTDVDTGSDPFPSAGVQSGGGYWSKSDGASNRSWVVFADDRFFVLFVAAQGANPTYHQGVCFGDFIPTRAGDAYAAMLAYFPTSQAAGVTGGQPQDMSNNSVMSTFFAYAPRSWSGVGTNVSLFKIAMGTINNGGTVASQSGVSPYTGWPNLADNALYLTQMMLVEGSSLYPIRGYVPGVGFVIHSVGGVFTNRDSVTITNGFFANRNMRAILNHNGSTQSTQFVDVTGPWR